MKILLIVTGVLAAIALLAPSLVTLGYFLFVIPGLTLTLAPTVFVYLAATALIRAKLPISAGPARNGIAFAIALLIGWAVMQPFRASELESYQATLQPDVASEHPVGISGNVRIEMSDRHVGRNTSPQLDHLSAAVLDLPDVKSVTVARNDEVVAYVIVPANEHPEPGLFPNDPGRILRTISNVRNFQKRKAAAQAVEADWALRLATDERIVTTEPVVADHADWILRQTFEGSQGDPEVWRVEVVDSNSTSHVRKCYVRHNVPQRVFYFGFHVQMSVGTISDSNFRVGHQTLTSGDETLMQDSERVLLDAIELPVPAVGDERLEDLRTEIIAMLDDPNASTARIELASRWLSLFFFDTTEDDWPLIARIVADDRIQNIGEPLENVFNKDRTPTELRIAYTKRILMDHVSEKERYMLAKDLASMPPGTFADPDAAHLAIWSSAEMRRQAGPFVARVADLGSQRATPVLLDALEASLLLEPWNKRRAVIDGIRAGFVQLGPEAASAIPIITELFLRRPSPILHNSGGASDWRFALVRMGVAIDDLPFFPNQSEKAVARIKNNIRNRMKRDTLERSAAGR